MQNESTPHQSPPSTPAPIPVHHGIAVLTGYNVRVCVEHGQLAVSDGIGAQRRAATFSRATSGLKRLVILGHTGCISFEALRWLHDIGAAVVQIDADGQVILDSAPLGLDNAHLRRAQALAAGTDAGRAIVRDLLRAKLTGQARVLRSLDQGELADRVDVAADTLDAALTTDDLRQIESHAASLYWSAWASVPVRFARRDVAKVPPHWQTFGPRASPLTRSPRNAAIPSNALLNYLYAILEVETRIALLTVGLDPGLGLLHADQPARDSLACDVMEAVRPDVDAWLLAMLKDRTFAKADFFERNDGVCRVTVNLARELAETEPLWAKAVAPVAEWVAQTLIKGHKPKVALPTKLTEGNRSAGRVHVRSQDKTVEVARHDVAVAAKTVERPPAVCPECGKVLPNRERKFCSDECFQAHNADVLLPTFAAAGPAALAQARAEGKDPAHGGEVGRKRGQTNAKRAEERARWDAEHGETAASERERFSGEILPQLAEVPLSRIIEATGVSLRYASLIRRGLYTPHPMHYDALARLANIPHQQELP